jgi:hypothetical protein
MISDVPGDDPRVIGSGLLHAPDDSTAVATPAVPVRVVASIGVATRAAAAAARAAGLKPRVVRARLAGDAAGVGTRIAASLARQPAGLLQVRGGESTVQLPAAPGRGGRNQHLALAAALEQLRYNVFWDKKRFSHEFSEDYDYYQESTARQEVREVAPDVADDVHACYILIKDGELEEVWTSPSFSTDWAFSRVY